MKKVVRDILVVVVLFAAVLAAPLILEEVSSADKQQVPVIKTAPEMPEPTAAKAPPMPEPENNIIERSSNFPPLSAPSVSAPAPEGEDSCSLSGLRTYISSTNAILNSRGDSFIFGGAEDAGDAITMSVDGGGGTDRLEIHGPGYLILDGQKLRAIEVLMVRNGVPNEVRISASGLATLSSGHAVIDGDTSDKVVLPSCLEWREPVPVTVGDVNYLRYDAEDSSGNRASVSIASEVLVEKR